VKVAFITNICPHYRVKTFETLAKYFDLDLYFFSAGNEWYWQRQHGVKSGSFRHEYLPGISLGGTRITPTLPYKLWAKDYDVYVKCIGGRFALPATMLVAHLRKKPFVLWTGVWMRLGNVAHKLMWPLTKYVYQHADAIVVYGDHVKRYLVSEGVPAERIYSAHHAVDNAAYDRVVPEVERLALRERLSAGDHRIVLYLGRLEENKGLDYLIEAFAAVQDRQALLVLAGEGSDRPRLEALSRDGALPAEVIHALRSRYADRLTYIRDKSDGNPGHENLARVRDDVELQLLAAERDAINELYRNGELQSEPRRRIERELDMRDAHLVSLKDDE